MNMFPPSRVAPSRQRIFLATLLLITLFLGAVNLGTAPAQAIGDGNKPIRMTLAEIAAQASQAATSPAGLDAAADTGAMVPDFIEARIKAQAGGAPVGVPNDLSAPSSIGGGDAPQTIGANFTSATLNELVNLGGGSVPPDTMGAVGPTQFVTNINTMITVYDKNGVSQNLTLFGNANGVTLNTFFNSVRNGTGPFDTRVRFDKHTNRWILLAETRSATVTSNRLLLAVSDGPVWTTSTVFQFFFLDFALVQPTLARESDCFFDYPTLGIDEDALYVGANIFVSGALYPCTQFASFGFAGSSAFVIRKADLLNAATPADITTYNPGVGNTATAFRGLLNLTPPSTGDLSGPYTPQGVDNFDTGTNEGYFIGVNICCNDIFELVIRRVSNPGGVPTMSGNLDVALPVPYDYPLDMPHLGSTGERIDAINDGRLFAAHIRNGVLHTASSAAVLPTGLGTGGAGSVDLRTGISWVLINNLATTPAVTQSGIVFDPTATASNPTYYAFPTIMSSGQGHMALGVSASSAATFAGAATVGRLATDAPGTMQGLPVVYQAGLAAYNLVASGRNRWGDYSYTSLDPCDDMTMWTIQEYAHSPTLTFSIGTGSWGTRVAELIAPAPTITEVSPASVAPGQASVVLTVTGTGFYDMVANGINPATGCPANPFGASVSGLAGVSVNSVTWVSATQVQVNVSTAGASAGTVNLTLTNSDGQTGGGSFGVAAPGDKIGAKSPAVGLISLRNDLSAGAADYTLLYGFPADIPLTGDWNGDNIDTFGFYRPTTAFFTLSDQQASAVVGIPTSTYNFGYGSLADRPIVGDWDGNGSDSVGVYRASNRTFYLRNTLNGGFANVTIFAPFALSGDIAIAGDWNGDGRATPGVYRPSTSQFLLTNTFTTGTAVLSHSFTFGSTGSLPIVGDWDGNNSDGIGTYSGGTFNLRNTLSAGGADFTFVFGAAGNTPLAGRWTSGGGTAPVEIEVAPAFEPQRK